MGNKNRYILGVAERFLVKIKKLFLKLIITILAISTSVFKKLVRILKLVITQLIVLLRLLNTKIWLPLRQKLILRFPVLQKWEKWAYRPRFRNGLTVLVAFVMFGYILQSAIMAAPDLNETWDLSNPADYTYDNGLEMVSGVARHKAQNYQTDANTAALYHFDESGGTNAADSSTNNNNLTTTNTSFTNGNLNNALNLNGVNTSAVATGSSSLQLGQNQTIEGWTKFNTSFNQNNHDKRNAIVDKGDYQVYYDNETGKLVYQLANSSANSWTQEAGNSLNGSWGTNTKRSVSSSTVVGSSVYAGLGNTTSDAEVWRWNGSTWTMIGGDGLNGSWDDQTFEEVYAMANDGTNVFVGLGNSTGDAEVWQWNGTSWAKIGGDGVNSSWQVSMFETVGALDYFGGNLYAGLGTSANDGEVWRWNGSIWAKIGGDSLNGGWTTNYEFVSGLTNDGTNLYAGLGISTGDAEVWRWNGSSWSKIGGDGLNSSWNTNYETVRSLRYFGGTLYAGLGDSTDDAEVWSWNGSAWTKIGGDGVNSSWPASTYEGVYAIGTDGTNIYAGLGSGNGDGEVWRWNGSSWTKIGGDGVNNSWPTNNGDVVNILPNSGTTVYAGVYDTAGGGYMYSWNGSSWTVLGGQYINNSWGYYGQASVEVMQVAGEHLYAGIGLAAGSAQVWQMGSNNNWKIVGGQGINNSWDANNYERVSSMSSHKGKLYVGLGTTTGDAEVWSFDGSTWTQIGGDNLNGGWDGVNYEEVNALASYGGNLYAGLGNSNNDAEVWRWDGTSWTKIGGDSLNGGWTSNYDKVGALASYNGNLVAGIGGTTAGEGELWQWNGSSWTKIGGDGLGGSWDSSIRQVEALIQYDNKLIVGLGYATGDADIWELDGSTWTQIGGDTAGGVTVNNSWTAGTYERARTLAVFNGELYAGLGSGTGDGEVWKFSEGAWAKVGGNSFNSSWANNIEEVEAFSPYRGKLYAGTGNSANADATIWSYGDSGYLESNASSFDTNWHHVAVSYDGNFMKMYIDGQLDNSLQKSFTVVTSNKKLYVGSGYGGREYGKPQARFEGSLDEIRLSNIARTSFTAKPYSTSQLTIKPNNAVRKSGVWHWDQFSQTANLSGGSVTYRLSSDNGTSWLFWDGSNWVTSTNLNESNLASVINSNIKDFPVTFDGFMWQAVISGNGNQQVSLDAVNADATSDTTKPSANPTNITAQKVQGGPTLAEGAWTNSGSPYFSWDAGSDSQSGIKGYCAYLGTDQSADPVTTKGLLGNSPASTGGNCQFIVEGNSLDLATTGLLGTSLTSSNDNYYLSLRSIDKASNVTNNSTQFSFRFDNTPPTNPGFITAPSGYINTKAVTLSWPTSGSNAPKDDNSGLVGLQYKIGENGTWYGDSHSGSGDINDLLTNDGIYDTLDPIDFNELTDGINKVYFRTWDLAGNVSTIYVSATLKINTSNAPSEPTSLVANPATSNTNSFSFSWSPPNTFVGDVNKITYCYTVNVLPSDASCSYTAQGVTNLNPGPYATQPGTNILYVVAKDESGNKNFGSYTSVNFVANTASPGFPLNTDIVDVSIKNTSNWRLALTWDQPSFVGSGVSSYRIYRSTNNSSFSQVGTSSSTTYIDAGLTQQTYYYKVTACDNTNNCGAFGSVVSAYPTGKFTSPANLTSGPIVSAVTTKKATVNWTTDRASDSKIAIGTKSGEYSPAEVGNSNQVSDHKIELDNLAPGTTYYFKVKWTDEDGNTGISPEQTFTTSAAPSIKEAEVSAVSLSNARINFTTKGATKATVYYGTSESFGGLKTINTATSESRYQVELDGLADGTKYYYMISTTDQEGSEYKGNISSFTTPARPRINNLRFQPISGEPTSTQKVTWETNVPSSSQVIYNIVNGQPIELQDSKLVTSHEVIIRDLKDDSQYTLVAISRDSAGNAATSDRQVFKTALDTRPPKIYDVVIEPSIRGSGSEARGQIVISWRTDEPSTSQIAYAEGSGAVTFNSKTAEDTRLTTEHIVIVSDLPTSRVYSVQPLSKDGAKNEGQGETQTAIIGRASDNAITVVFNTLKAIFGL